MSTTRDGIWSVFECDGNQHGRLCANFERGEGFEETWSLLKAEGWKVQKKGTSWLHFCPSCQNDSLSILTKGL